MQSQVLLGRKVLVDIEQAFRVLRPVCPKQPVPGGRRIGGQSGRSNGLGLSAYRNGKSA
ncbi:hypothetical protein [Streptomyces sp. NPDC017940]|uniref:hypothetical protein n=1 Tax=Streptomyces sp. NPDC017940 TaxID=3365017 RepID=UPI003797C9BB